MSTETMPGPERADEDLVRHYLAALSRGEIIEVLDAFSMDASMRDELGRERRGIREIAKAFASQVRPSRVEVEALERTGDAVAARVRMDFPTGHETQVYRTVFRVRRNRIHSLVIDAIPRLGGRKPGSAHRA